MLYQQGDVLFQRPPLEAIRDCNRNRQVPCNGRYILVEGEHTGHMHCVREEGVSVHRDHETKELILRCTMPVLVTHPEHAPILLPTGFWIVSKVKEYDHFSENIHDVED
jgi:hypothetical protein